MPYILLDTNVLLRNIQQAHPMYEQARDAVAALIVRADQPCIVAQNLVEFRAVCTRPAAVNGLGFSESLANAEITRLQHLLPTFADDPAILGAWERLVIQHGASGKQNHDARLVAAMIVHGASRVLTFNKDDFARYPEITAMTPQEVLIGTTRR